MDIEGRIVLSDGNRTNEFTFKGTEDVHVFFYIDPTDPSNTEGERYDFFKAINNNFKKYSFEPLLEGINLKSENLTLLVELGDLKRKEVSLVEISYRVGITGDLEGVSEVLLGRYLGGV